MKKILILSAGTILIYSIYLHFPQKFEVGQCFQEDSTSEIYRVLTKSQRDLSFKDNWIFAEMKIEGELIKPNSNTQRKAGEHRFFYPTTEKLELFKCD